MDQNRATRAEIMIIAAGAVTVIGAFLPFWEVPLVGSTNAWGRLLFPVATLMPIFGLVMAAQVAAARFGSVRFPERVLSFSWPQVHLALGLFAALLALCYLVVDKGVMSFGFGYWIVLLGCLGLATGAVMLEREPTPR
ncbi:MAG: hypothetical protein ACXW1M_06155 [Acidimicrobiia bacterium]